MDSITDVSWDLVIEGTGLRQSLLALALSRSNKRVLHVDPNAYYGADEASFSLQEAEVWVANVSKGNLPSFKDATIWRSTAQGLSFPRAYTLALSPQIIYSKSKFISALVSSRIHRQLEFQSVGNWWIWDASRATASERLRRLPNGREDIFQDTDIDNRSKRGLMKFLVFVIDHQDRRGEWQEHADSSLSDFLTTQFKLPSELHNVISALTLSYQPADHTSVSCALPRIARHLTSIGVFGPGFGGVYPKWGGGSEIAQVACRAGAVGGGVYMLDTGITDVTTNDNTMSVGLTDGSRITTKSLERASTSNASETGIKVTKVIAVVKAPLSTLFRSTVEGAPIPAVSVVFFPGGTLAVGGARQRNPVYVLAHSGSTGECPDDQWPFANIIIKGLLYASTITSPTSSDLLDLAIDELLACFPPGSSPNPAPPASQDAPDDAATRAGTPASSTPEILYKLRYTQTGASITQTNPDQPSTSTEPDINRVPTTAYASSISNELAYKDELLDDLEATWRRIMTKGASPRDAEAEATHGASDTPLSGAVMGEFMKFSDKRSRGDDEYDDEM